MSIFACAIDTDGGRVPDHFRARIEGSPFVRGRDLRWHKARGFLGAVAADDAAPSVAHLGWMVAIGVARLDNRADVLRWCCSRDDDVSDLALAMRYVTRDDGARIEKLLGDFAFVVWNPTRRLLLAARDSLGVRKLFHDDGQDGVLTFASHASLVAQDDRYDTQYLVDRLAQRGSEPGRTIFAGVRAVPAATLLRIRGRASEATRYWTVSAAQAASAPPASPTEQVEAFRTLLVDAVRLRLSGDEGTWSQLSGGMDSSSVVSIAQWLAWRGVVPCGISGTVSYTDDLGTGADERVYSDAVAARWGLRNERVPHRADEELILRDPPLLDQPNLPYAVAARDLAAAHVIRSAGGRVLLTGEGGDALVAGTMFFFADWLVTGRAGESLREMAHRAALGHVSFWRLAYENALLPLLPVRIRTLLTRARAGAMPPWISRAMARRHESAASWSPDRLYRGRRGFKYADALASTIAAIPATMPLGPQDDLIERRHPYLHRPLVELALGLTSEMCVRPHQRKWILRESMRGILPEEVRTRVGKGALDGVNAWSLAHGNARVARLLRDPILAQLGIVEPSTLRALLAEARSGRAGGEVWADSLHRTLELEMWLQLRSGRWAADDSQRTRTKQVQGSQLSFTHIGQSSRSIP